VKAICLMGCHILWRWYVLVLAIEVVLPTELTRPGFVALLLSCSTVVTSLCGANLFAPYLLASCACILSHVRALRIRTLVVRSCWRRRRVERLPIVVMCRAYGVAVAVGHMAIRVLPWTLVASMIHGWWLRLDVGTDTGSSALRLWLCRRLGSGGRPVGSDVVLGDVHRRRATGAMRALAR
jgi:hypothetical protein